MLIHATQSEGEMWMGYEASALAIHECYKTGILKTKYAGELKLATLMMSGSNLIYDFILKERDHCPVRYIYTPWTDNLRWATDGPES